MAGTDTSWVRMAAYAGRTIVGVSVPTFMPIILFCSVVFVAVEASKLTAIRWHVMAYSAIVPPFVAMFAGENREELGVVVDELATHSGGVAKIAILAVVAVTRYPLMHGIGNRPCVMA